MQLRQIKISARLVFLVALVSGASFGVLPPAYADDSFTVPLTTQVVSQFKNSAAKYRTDRQRQKFTLGLRIASGPITAELEPHNIRSADYRAELTGDNGTVADPVTVDLFKGIVVGGEYARFALIRNPRTGAEKVRGFFRTGGKYYDVSQYSSNELVVEELSAAKFGSMVAACGTDRLPSNGRITMGGAGRSAFPALAAPPSEADSLPTTAAAGTLKEAEIASEADFEMSQAAGSGSSANAEFLTTINSVSAVYEAQLGIRLTVTFQHAWTTSSDPYSGTSPDALLSQFTTYWTSNYAGSQHYDVAHFRTGVELDSNIIGLAWLDAVCTSYKYGLSQRLGSSSYDVPLVAHEVGHNFGANHDSCPSGVSWVMCPYLIQNETDFSSTSKTAIASYVGSISCLSTVSGPAPTPTPTPAPPANHPPVLSPIGARSVNEAQTVSFSISATDADGNALSYSASPLPTGASLSGQTFSYTPPYEAVNGTASTVVNVTFTATDSLGAAASEVVPITVYNVNRTPSLSAPGTRNAAEGSAFSYQLAASDPDNDVLTYTAPSGLPAGAMLNPQTGAFFWMPAGNQAGTYDVAVRAADIFGASANATLRIIVQDVAGITPLPPRYSPGDFDAAGGSDAAVFRGITGEWYSGSINGGDISGAQFGLPGDVTVPGDYNGDRVADRAVFRPSTGSWYISYSLTGQTDYRQFGLSGDLPAPADYDGDGRTDVAVFRPSTGLYVVQSSYNGAVSVISLGAAGDVPVPCDYDGDGKADPALFRPAGGLWSIHNSSNGQDASSALGLATDIPVPGDYNGDGRCELAVWRPATGNWYIGAADPLQFGLGGDVPVPGDYDGNGTTDLAVYRPGIGGWFLRLADGSAQYRQLGLYTDVPVTREQYHYAARKSPAGSPAAVGPAGDGMLLYRRKGSILTTVRAAGQAAAVLSIPVGAAVVRGDYDGDRTTDTAVFYNGAWTIYRGVGGAITVGWGVAGDRPVAADFDGDGKTDVAVYRPNNGAGYSAWYVIKSSDGFAAVYSWGLPSDEPIAADFNGDGWADPGVFRPSTGSWYVIDGRSGGLIQAVQWGLAGDQPRAVDFDGDGRADKTVFRPSIGTWFVAYSSGSGNTIRWGAAGDTAVPGAYVNSARNDFAVWRPSAKSLLILSTDGTTRTVKTTAPATDQVIGISPPVVVR